MDTGVASAPRHADRQPAPGHGGAFHPRHSWAKASLWQAVGAGRRFEKAHAGGFYCSLCSHIDSYAVFMNIHWFYPRQEGIIESRAHVDRSGKWVFLFLWCFFWCCDCGAGASLQYYWTSKRDYISEIDVLRLRKWVWLYLNDVFIGGLALHEGRDVGDRSVHLDGDHFDGNGDGASGQDGRVDNLSVLRRD